jgi:hypothetical protein
MDANFSAERNIASRVGLRSLRQRPTAKEKFPKQE